MKINLAETVKFCFTEEVIAQLANVLGESETRVKNGLVQAVPLVLNGILKQAEQEGNPSALLHRAREVDAANSSAQFTDLADPNWYEQGGIILVELLGGTYGATMSQLAQESGLLPPAAERLLQLAAATVFGVVGNFAANNNLTPNTFIQWLRWQKADITAAMLPTLQSLSTAASTSRPPATVPPRVLAATPPRATTTGNWPIALGVAPDAAPAGAANWRWQLGSGVLLLLAVSLGYFFGHDRQQPAAEAGVAPAATVWPATTSPAAKAAAAKAPAAVATGRYDQNRDTYIYDTGQPTVLKLTNGKTQKVGANSTENRLYTFLSTPSVQVDSVNRTKGWINFDRVYFEPSKATLTPESAQQLQNVAEILKTFPKSVVKIGGYSDSSGVAAHNFQLSEERAKTAMLTLSNLGVPMGSLQYKGYGSRYFVVSNNTPTGRALNRRISIRVVQK